MNKNVQIGDEKMVHIRFQDLRISAISTTSGVYSGNNRQYKYKHSIKKNQAFGTVSGQHCFVLGHRSLLDDRDRIDMRSIGRL